MPRESWRSWLGDAIHAKSGKCLPFLHALRTRSLDADNKLGARKHNAANATILRLPPEIRRQIMDYLFSGTIMLIVNEYWDHKPHSPEVLCFSPRWVTWSIDDQVACIKCTRKIYNVFGHLRWDPDWGHSDLLPFRDHPCPEHGGDQGRDWEKYEHPYSAPVDLRPLLVCRAFYRDAYDALAAADYVLPRTKSRFVCTRKWPCLSYLWPKAHLPAYVRRLIIEDAGTTSIVPLDTYPSFSIEQSISIAAQVDALHSWACASAPGLERLELLKSYFCYDGGFAEETINAMAPGRRRHQAFRYLEYILDLYGIKLTCRIREFHRARGANSVIGSGGEQTHLFDDIPLDIEKLVRTYKEKEREETSLSHPTMDFWKSLDPITGREREFKPRLNCNRRALDRYDPSGKRELAKYGGKKYLPLGKYLIGNK